MNLCIFLLLNLIIILSAIKISGFSRTRTTRHSVFPDIVILFLSQIIITEIMLGLFRLLTPLNLLLLNTAICVLACLIRKTPASRIQNCHDPNDVNHSTYAGWLSLPFLATVIMVYLFQAYRFLRHPPMHWDDWTYHLTYPVEWMRSHCLENPPSVFGDFAPTYYPMNTELINYFLLAPLRSDLLVRISQHVFLGIAAYTLFCILSMLGFDRSRSLMITLSFGCMPYLMTQGLGLAVTQTISNDITALALYLLAILYLIKFLDDFSCRHAAFAGLSLGLFIGSKYIALLFSLPLFILTFFPVFLRRKNQSYPFRATAVLYMTMATTGSFFYIRNMVRTGNPVYPAEIRFLSRIIFPGFYKPEQLNMSLFHTRFKWTDIIGYPGYDMMSTLFLILVFFLTLILIIFRKPSVRVSIKRKTCFPERFFLLLPIINILIFYFLVPYRNMRFLIFPISTFYIVTAILNRMNSRIFTYLSIVLAAGIITSCITCLHAEFYPFDTEKRFPHPFEQQVRAPGWNWLQHFLNRSERGYRIACSGTNAVYPLYGDTFSNVVFYVPVNDNSTYLHDYVTGHFRTASDPDTWRDNLIEYETDLLYTCVRETPGGIRFEMEDYWASGFRNDFEILYGDLVTHIYRFIGKRLQPPVREPAYPSVVTLDGLPLFVACPGKLFVCCCWFIPESFRTATLSFDYTLSGIPVHVGRFPSPGRTRFVIHRFPYDTPAEVLSGLHNLAVTITDTRPGNVIHQADLAFFRYADALELPQPNISSQLAPENGAVLNSTSRFQWTPVAPEMVYEVSISDLQGHTGSLFTSRTDLDIYFNPANPVHMKPGTYSWCLRAINEFGVMGDFSESHSFTIEDR